MQRPVEAHSASRTILGSSYRDELLRAGKTSARPGLDFYQRFAKVLAREQVCEGLAAPRDAVIFVG